MRATTGVAGQGSDSARRVNLAATQVMGVAKVRGLRAARPRKHAPGRREKQRPAAARLTCDRDEELAAGLVVGRGVRAVAAGPRWPLGGGGHRHGARPLQPAPVCDAHRAADVLQLDALQISE